MKKTWHNFAIISLIAGQGLAELPTSSLAPSGESYISQDIKSCQTKLSGKVVELLFNRTYNSRRSAPGDYEVELLCYDQECSGPIIHTPEEGLPFFLDFAFKEANMGDVHAKKTRSNTSVYVLIERNTTRLIALGNQCSKESDGTATYSWSGKKELPDTETLQEKDEWSATELILYGHHIIGQEIEVTCCQIGPQGIVNVSGGTYKTSVNSGFGHACICVDFSGEDALEFFQEIQDEGMFSETLFSFYARVNAHGAHDIELSALGTRSRGKGLKRTYRW